MMKNLFYLSNNILNTGRDILMSTIKMRRLRELLFGILALLAMQDVAALSAGATAYEEQRYQDAFQLLTLEANNGDSEAQYLLGTLYFDGLGVTHSPKDAVKWLKRASKNHHPAAAHMLGKIYLSGVGVPMDVDKGIYYMQLADEFTPDEEEEECD
ncbi:MAG: hypothetical protein GQ470_00690 [Gammaproteobacteria bacterium]|nr:hypothetical protein [Gammaproteobacteria bacterium]